MFGSEKYRIWNRHPGMNGGGGSGGGTSKTTTEIPVELKPLATKYTQEAMSLADQPFVNYNDPRYADLTAPQTQGIEMVQQRALEGSPTFDAANQNLMQMMQGGQNPYLDQMFENAAGRVASNVNSNFSLGGRYGSGAHTGTLADSLGNMATQMYGGAYENDQARRMQAIGMAPQFANQAYTDASQMLNAGQILQDQAQNPLDFQYQQFQEEQNLPYKNLAAMSGVFGSNLGSSSVTKSSGGGGK